MPKLPRFTAEELCTLEDFNVMPLIDEDLIEMESLSNGIALHDSGQLTDSQGRQLLRIY